MNQVRVPPEELRRPMGPLACVTTGFEVVARAPWLAALPLLLDLFLWLGPRLSIAPILQDIKALFIQLGSMSEAVPDVGDAYLILSQILDELSTNFNLLSLLNPAPLLGVPVLMPTRMTVLNPLGDQRAIEIASFSIMMLGVLVLGLVSLGLTAAYLAPIGRRVIAETESPLPGPTTILTLWGEFLKVGILILGALLAFATALSFLATLIGLFSLTLAGLVMTLASSAVLFIAVHLVFTIPGIVQLRKGISTALRESLLLTRSDFLHVVFLLGLVLVISQGLRVVWTLPNPDSWSTIVGLAGHAFVSTALTAALLVFYQERLQYLEVMKQIYATRLKKANAHPAVGE